jgi:hypothetical protein
VGTSFLYVLALGQSGNTLLFWTHPRVSFNNGLAAPKNSDLDSPVPLLF